MSKKKYKYVLWDFDGTVADTYPGIAQALKAVFPLAGVHEEREEVLRTFIGPPFSESFPAAYGFDEETTNYLIGKYREYYNAGAMFNCTVYDGVPQALADLRSAGYGQYIASSKPKEACVAILKSKEIYGLFDGVFGATPDGRINTKIQVLEEAFRVLDDYDKSRYVLIGDTKYDVIGAEKAQIDCVGITYGMGSRQELEENGASAVFDTIREAAQWIMN